MDGITLIRWLNEAKLSYERLAELLATAYTKRKYSKSTIARWACGDNAIPKEVVPHLAYLLGRNQGNNDQLNHQDQLAILQDQRKMVVEIDVYNSLVHLAGKGLNKVQLSTEGNS